MTFYDIHTHQRRNELSSEDSISIYNLSENEIRDGFRMTLDNEYYSCGIHPWSIENSQLTIKDIHSLVSANKKIVAIGECGLDKVINVPMETQMSIFEQHIILAEELKLPLIIHCVKAWDELLKVSKVHKPKMPWVLHGFRGRAEQAEQLVKFGFYFSFGEYFNEETLKLAYPHRFFVETDESCINIHSAYRRINSVLSFKNDDVLVNVEQNVKRVFKL